MVIFGGKNVEGYDKDKEYYYFNDLVWINAKICDSNSDASVCP